MHRRTFLAGLAGLTALPLIGAPESAHRPFWRASVMRDEPLFFGEREPNGELTANLLFDPTGPVAIEGFDGTVYEEGRDFSVEGRIVRRLDGSRMPFRPFAEVYPAANSAFPSKYPHRKGDPQTHLLYGEGRFFRRMQVTATYSHAGGWDGYKTQLATDSLPMTLQKLRDRAPIRIALTGDSITAGANATQTPYPELVAQGLRLGGATVTVANFAAPGKRSDQGFLEIADLAAEKPDLTIIAYGMNDSHNKPPRKFAEYVEGMMSAVRAQSPQGEFILTSALAPNPEWSHPAHENFPAMRDELARMCGRCVALADLTQMSIDMQKRKSYLDLTGNGLNHPNDFGHRLYADVILGLLTETGRRRAVR